MTSLTVPLERALQVAADDVAIVVAGGGTLTYRELATRARRLGHALRERGLHQGDRVAVAGPNTLGHLELLLSVPLAGMVVVPLNARHTDDELLYALRDSGSRVLFTDRDPTPFRDDVEHVLALEEDYEALVAPGGEEAAWAEGLDRDSLAALFYTGGTTGAAKGVMTTHGGMTSNALHFMSSWPFGPETRWLVAAPLFHAAGSVAVVPTVWTGGTQVLLDAFHPGKVLDLIASERVTDTVLVPTMIAAIIDEQQREPRDVSSWRRLMHGGSPIAMQTLRRCHETFPDLELAEVYGATETGPLLTMFKGEHELLDDPRGRSCGQPIVGVQIRLVDEAWQDVAPGEVGEVAARGPNITIGYWNKPEQTDAVLRDGWYRTGDLAHADERGHLFVVDRAKDMIITGGENVYCSEVEDVLARHEAVQEVAVFGVPDPRWGEAVFAVVLPRQPVDEDVLLEHCRKSIAGYKVPKAIELRTEPLPKSAAGKLLKRVLRDPHWQGSESRVAGS